MDNTKILIVDDEYRIRKLVGDFLKPKGYSILEADDGEDALDMLEECKDLSLIVLDVMLPKLSGWDVLRVIRKSYKIPVIMLTAKDQEEDELNSFVLGADDFVQKPFSPSILVARIEALLKRSHGYDDKDVFQVGAIKLDDKRRNISIDGMYVELTPKEYELLLYLIKNKGVALSRENILNNVWNYNYYGDLRTVDTHIKQLRAKLSTKGKYIKTVRTIGYRFEVDEDEIH